MSNVPAENQTPILSPWPSSQWGIDIVGLLQMGKGQVWFTVIAVDYFTKWAEAESLAAINKKKMEHFAKWNIISRFGIPRVLISDNRRQFNIPVFRQFCSNYGISSHYSSPEHQQANGQAEATNRIVLQSIKTQRELAKELWVEELLILMWAYRTTPWAPTGKTPFSLTFEFEAVVPIEVDLPFFRTGNFQATENDEVQRQELDLVKEKQDRALIRAASYKQRTSQYSNKKFKHRRFQVGDLVLKKVNQSTRVPNYGKLGANWEGPNQVTRVNRPGTY